MTHESITENPSHIGTNHPTDKTKIASFLMIVYTVFVDTVNVLVKRCLRLYLTTNGASFLLEIPDLNVSNWPFSPIQRFQFVGHRITALRHIADGHSEVSPIGANGQKRRKGVE